MSKVPPEELSKLRVSLSEPEPEPEPDSALETPLNTLITTEGLQGFGDAPVPCDLSSDEVPTDCYSCLLAKGSKTRVRWWRACGRNKTGIPHL